MKKVISTVGMFLFTVFAVTAQTEGEVTDAQLQKFADAYQEVQMSNQAIQQEMVVAIEKEGLTPERFNELYEAKMDPEKEIEATEEEIEKQDAVMVVIQEIQKDSQAKMEEKVKEKGLTMEQFQKIGAQIQESPELQQKMQAMMMKQQTGKNPMKKN
ncbi:DUF4168 domain-containing protein [Psychroflexus sp. CAK8W]|uniref:DUF4168 domain-containing protein n=1 Tax=Psychroflexus longus TaxID=2873596 RepID=A0ABS7XL73_9FLAO|nr:DUF4168 domain-containing protein [Psychroflexus longus]MBZ9779149.1 DUF4168 domain-containing protein [Psychroflexus longus]